jgi:Polyketide cyclase / dehydrase and lipid transport
MVAGLPPHGVPVGGGTPDDGAATGDEEVADGVGDPACECAVTSPASHPDDVFAYLDDLARHGEGQGQIISAQKHGDGPTQVGTKSTEKRRMGGREQTMSYAVTEHDPPRAFGFQGIDGPIRVVGRFIVEPVGDGSSSWLSLVLEFEGHGFGKLLVPLALSQTRKQVPKDQ